MRLTGIDILLDDCCFHGRCGARRRSRSALGASVMRLRYSIGAAKRSRDWPYPPRPHKNTAAPNLSCSPPGSMLLLMPYRIYPISINSSLKETHMITQNRPYRDHRQRRQAPCRVLPEAGFQAPDLDRPPRRLGRGPAARARTSPSSSFTPSSTRRTSASTTSPSRPTMSSRPTAN